MSDIRQPEQIWTKKLPGKQGKFQMELFPARQWAGKCRPSLGVKVEPLITRPDELDGLYRVRVDGKWHGGRHRYVFLNINECLEVFRDG